MRHGRPCLPAPAVRRTGGGSESGAAAREAEKASSRSFMRRLLRVPRSSYYAWRHRAETPTTARRRVLAEQVQRFPPRIESPEEGAE
ncbi:hypothetical protein ACXC9Q_30315 [Kribbella sp. CWNU-51]